MSPSAFPTRNVESASGGAARPDEVQPSIDVRDALANAPEPAATAGMFKVPRVIG